MSHVVGSPGSDGSGEKGQELDLQAHAHWLLGRRAARAPELVHAELHRSVGERMADSIAKAAGSWFFISVFLIVLMIWMALNVMAGLRHWDPYPFILLNLVLSCIAAIQAPVILMSQNRAEARDRIRAEDDYNVNLKAEILLEHLTEEIEALKAALNKEER